MFYLIVAVVSLAAAVLALLLLREVRLRRALQALLAKFLTFWRNHHAPSRGAARRDRPDPADRLR